MVFDSLGVVFIMCILQDVHDLGRELAFCATSGNLTLRVDPREETRSQLKLSGVMFVQVAAHVSRNSQPPPPFTGHAFCFLPLPVKTLLPVHVNGFFEVSSNRRDIVSYTQRWVAAGSAETTVECMALYTTPRTILVILRRPECSYILAP